ncbi:MAG: Crp/Fnr family transcriptional regulator [Christensenellaceae bacterium]|nr:Crp/Fnr family transcriptional regulator [Christensenellaceae bacterium]
MTGPLFAGICDADVEKMLRCFNASTRHYGAGVDIPWLESRRRIGVLQMGRAELIRLDGEGNRTMLERLEQGDVFGEMLRPSVALESLSLQCTAPCEVLFIDGTDIIKRCERACVHHSALVDNLLGLIADKAVRLSERVEVLSCRSIRAKLMVYFQLLQVKQGGARIVVPMSLTELADYICVERSAMMRELKHMEQDGSIERARREIVLK